jgi:Sec-independent protein translocase protein TatA
VGFGTEVLFIVVLGVLLLGPQKVAAILGHIARAKAQLERASGDFKAQLSAELEPTSRNETATSHPKTAGEQ